jgi:hypothetical protein
MIDLIYKSFILFATGFGLWFLFMYVIVRREINLGRENGLSLDMAMVFLSFGVIFIARAISTYISWRLGIEYTIWLFPCSIFAYIITTFAITRMSIRLFLPVTEND